jgi:membrane protease YdiL (CAAX protease family)
MTWPGAPPTNPRLQLTRLLVLVALAAAAGVMLQTATTSGPGAPRRDPAAVQAVFLGDLLYRLGLFVEAQSRQQQAVEWYPGYLLEQAGIARYERYALGPRPDAEALLRLGIIYSRSGYLEPGRQALVSAGELDVPRYPLYAQLAQLYAPGRPTPADLNAAHDLLQNEPRWLWRIVSLDREQASGTPGGPATLEWQRDLSNFGLALVAVGVVIFLLIAAGAVLVVVWLGRRLFTLPARRHRAPLPVTWSVAEAVESLIIIFFLLAVVSTVASLLGPHLPPGRAGSLARAGVLALVYLAYLALALAFPYTRAARAGRRSWRLLGLQRLPAGQVVGQGLRAYALFWAVLILPLRYYFGNFMAASGPSLSGGESAGAYVIYFVLLCVAAPVVEEILFRGFLYGGLRQVLPTGSAAVLSALAFGAVHLPSGAPELAFLAAMGVALALLYEHTRSLWPGILVHILHNALIFGILVAALTL